MHRSRVNMHGPEQRQAAFPLLSRTVEALLSRQCCVLPQQGMGIKSAGHQASLRGHRRRTLCKMQGMEGMVGMVVGKGN